MQPSRDSSLALYLPLFQNSESLSQSRYILETYHFPTSHDDWTTDGIAPVNLIVAEKI